MKITIIGAGKLGFSLAESLTKESHHVTVVDKNEDVVEKLSTTLDVMCYVGSGASIPVLESVGIQSCDLLIACTGSDELNLLCCLSAHKLGARHTIARVRNPEYSDHLYRFKEDLGISMAVNPERATAKEIARVLRFPSAFRVELFANGRVELVSCRVEEDNAFIGERLMDIKTKYGVNVLVCAVERRDEVVIPGGRFTIEEDDKLYITGTPKEIEKAFKCANMLKNPVKNVMIAGGGKICYYLCEELQKQNMNVKIFEKESDVADDLAQKIENAVVVCSDCSDHDVLAEEGISKTDAFVSVTGIDENNIFSSLFAHNQNVPKVICKVNNENMSKMAKELGIESVVSPKRLTTTQIVRYVRALSDAEDNSSVLSLYRLFDGKAEITELEAEQEIEELTKVPIRSLPVKKNTLIASIVRAGEVIIPSGNDCIQKSDIVLVVSSSGQIQSLTDILEG